MTTCTSASYCLALGSIFDIGIDLIRKPSQGNSCWESRMWCKILDRPKFARLLAYLISHPPHPPLRLPPLLFFIQTQTDHPATGQSEIFLDLVA